MSELTKEQFYELWAAAQDSKSGVTVTCSDCGATADFNQFANHKSVCPSS